MHTSPHRPGQIYDTRGGKMVKNVRNPAVTRMIAQDLVEHGVDSISRNPDTVLRTMPAILETEVLVKAPPRGTPSPQHAMPREEAV